MSSYAGPSCFANTSWGLIQVGGTRRYRGSGPKPWVSSTSQQSVKITSILISRKNKNEKNMVIQIWGF
jgi:hypothetical protein